MKRFNIGDTVYMKEFKTSCYITIAWDEDSDNGFEYSIIMIPGKNRIVTKSNKLSTSLADAYELVPIKTLLTEKFDLKL